MSTAGSVRFDPRDHMDQCKSLILEINRSKPSGMKILKI
jgi:hypothetical protein